MIECLHILAGSLKSTWM